MDDEYKQVGDHDDGGKEAGKPTRINITDGSWDGQADSESLASESESILVIGEEHSTEEVGNGAATELEKVSDEPEVAESPVIEAEIEPETVAFVAVPSEPEVASTQGALKSKKRIASFAAIGVVLVALVGIVAWALLRGNKPIDDDTGEETVAAIVEVPKLDVTASVVSGVAEYSSDGAEWAPITVATELNEGNSVRTGQGSRAVLTLESGSILRLDENTTIKLARLIEDTVEVQHTTGRMYSRVMEDKESYIVAADESVFKAVGTAFMTSVDPSWRELQVYEGEVEASDIDEGTVLEGKQYRRLLGDQAATFEVMDTDIDALTTDEFVLWNIDEDEKIATFANAMGILPLVKQRLETLEAEQAKAEAEAAEQAAKEAASRESIENPATKQEDEEKVSRVRRGIPANLGIFIDKHR